jgi:FG-GAP-like repeat/Bacterial pre-peptidase C-terminal domain
MSQQRPYFMRCFLACLLACLGLVLVSNLAAVVPRVLAAESASPAVVTTTTPIDLAPDDGSFVEIPVSLPGVLDGFAIWGDCNNDGALDVLLAGQVSSTLRIARVYQQGTGSNFTQAAAFTDVIHGAAAWGDYDNDGWLDVVLTGENAGVPITRLYHNARHGCTFTLVPANLVGVRNSTVAWGDYNADGQLDLVLAGDNGSQPITKIYRNNHGTFSDIGLNLPGIQNGVATWGDYNNDGLADLLLTGSGSSGQPLTKLYRNSGGALVEVQAGLPALSNSAAAWGDYDNDGYLDLLLEGTTITPTYRAQVYRNDHGTFVMSNDMDGSREWTSAAWGDYDTDGRLDALVTTVYNPNAYRNEIITGSFAAGIAVGAPLLSGSVAWGDYHEGLKVLLTGEDYYNGTSLTKIYDYLLQQNNAPQPPKYLTATVAGSKVVLRWSPSAGDDHTPLPGLSYNLRVGTQPGGVDIIAPMALVTTNLTYDGNRLLPALGNVYQARAITLSNLQLGKKYYWGVQAIDTSFLGSNFATGGSFYIPYRVYLPVVLKDFDFVSYYTSEWETEPNNNYLQSNGPLKSGQIYRGVHNDEKDYYSVYLPTSGAVNITMISPSSDTQLQLFFQIADVAHRVAYDVSPPYQINYTGAESGWYYIYVYTNPAFVGSQTYTLTVTYP